MQYKTIFSHITEKKSIIVNLLKAYVRFHFKTQHYCTSLKITKLIQIQIERDSTPQSSMFSNIIQ